MKGDAWALDCPDCKAPAVIVGAARPDDMLALHVRCHTCGGKVKYVPREMKVRKLRPVDPKQMRLNP